jgi:hypothetical protein
MMPSTGSRSEASKRSAAARNRPLRAGSHQTGTRLPSQLGTPYFAIFNGDKLVLFNTHEEGVPLLKRSTKSYEIGDIEPFADTLLDEIARLKADRISWDSLDDAFIDRIQTLHDLLASEFEDALATELNADDEFRESFVEWANAQGIEYDEAEAEASDQATVRERFASVINSVLSQHDRLLGEAGDLGHGLSAVSRFNSLDLPIHPSAG